MLGCALILLHLFSTFANNQNYYKLRTGLFYPPRQRPSPFDIFYTLQALRESRLTNTVMSANVASPGKWNRNELPMEPRKYAIGDETLNRKMASEADYGNNVAHILNNPDILLEQQFFQTTSPEGSSYIHSGKQEQMQPGQLHSSLGRLENGMRDNFGRNSDVVHNLHPNFVTPVELETKNHARMSQIKGQNSENVSPYIVEAPGKQQHEHSETVTDSEDKGNENSLSGKVSDSKNLHHRGIRSVDSSGMLHHNCHSANLHTCGDTVINKFTPDEKSVSKCKIREEFLDCMVKQRKKGCLPADEFKFSPEDTNSTRSEIKKFLWSAHGCLLL